jgi:hypothetical protein
MVYARLAFQTVMNVHLPHNVRNAVTIPKEILKVISVRAFQVMLRTPMDIASMRQLLLPVQLDSSCKTINARIVTKTVQHVRALAKMNV